MENKNKIREPLLILSNPHSRVSKIYSTILHTSLLPRKL